MGLVSAGGSRTRVFQTGGLAVASRWLADAALLATFLGFAGVLPVLSVTPSVGPDAVSVFLAAQPPEHPPITSLPAGTELFLRLETAVGTKTSHLRQAVTARVVREVPGGEGILIPLGTLIRGCIEKLIPSSSPTDRARLLLRFTRLEIQGQSPIALTGHLAEVDNARETVLPDGTIRGVLTSELPLSHLEAALGKLGKSHPEIADQIGKRSEKALGKPDTSIEYPAGTDVSLISDKPLVLTIQSSSTVPDQLAVGVNAHVELLLADAPQRTSSKGGDPGDPLNLVVIGNAEEIRHTFREAGWSEAEKKSGKSVWETIRAAVGDLGYSAAPVSQLYLYGRPEDLAFEKMLNTFSKRHHLRLWRSPATTSDGREIWVGAATHDIGIEVRPGVISHAIDPALDAERSKVGADLLVTGHVAAERLFTRPNPLTEGLTATGGSWKTDGKLLAIELKPGRIEPGVRPHAPDH